jgi:hypothetical protein
MFLNKTRHSEGRMIEAAVREPGNDLLDISDDSGDQFDAGFPHQFVQLLTDPRADQQVYIPLSQQVGARHQGIRRDLDFFTCDFPAAVKIDQQNPCAGIQDWGNSHAVDRDRESLDTVQGWTAGDAKQRGVFLQRGSRAVAKYARSDRHRPKEYPHRANPPSSVMVAFWRAMSDQQFLDWSVFSSTSFRNNRAAEFQTGPPCQIYLNNLRFFAMVP